MIPLLAWPLGLAAGWLVRTEGRKKHWFGSLPDTTAAKVMSVLHLSNDPAHLNALSAKLGQVGATGAATAAKQKAAAISDGATPVIHQGSTGPAVKQWQSIIGVTADGQFGPATAAATKAWQAAHGLTADGVVGALTWGASRGSVTLPEQTILAGVGPPLPRLGLGSMGEDVAGWQRFLNASGWARKANGADMSIDGIFGLKTRKATAYFQAGNGLPADGEVGNETRVAAARETVQRIDRDLKAVATKARRSPFRVAGYPGRI